MIETELTNDFRAQALEPRTRSDVIRRFAAKRSQTSSRGRAVALCYLGGYAALVACATKLTRVEPGLLGLAWVVPAVVALALRYPGISFGVFIGQVHTLALLFALPAAAVYGLVGEPLVALVAVVLALLLRRNKLSLVVSAAVVAQLALYGLLLVGTVRVQYEQDALTQAWRFSHSNVMPFMVALLFGGDTKTLRGMVIGFWVGCVAWGIFGPALPEDPSAVRLAAEGVGTIGLARAAGLGALLGFCLLIWSKLSLRTTIVAPLSALLVYQMLLTGTRGALIAFLISVVVALWLGMKLRTPRRFVLVGAAIAVLGLGLGLKAAPPEIADRLLNPDSYRTELYARQTSGTAQRLYLYRQAWAMFVRSPLWGLGPGAFREIAIYPHNVLLEVAVELGLAGVATFVLFIGLTLRSAWKGLVDPRATALRRQVIALGLVGLTFFLGEAQFSHNIVHNREIWFFCGLICAAARRMGESPARPGTLLARDN